MALFILANLRAKNKLLCMIAKYTQIPHALILVACNIVLIHYSVTFEGASDGRTLKLVGRGEIGS